MRFNLLSVISLVLAIAATGCSDDKLYPVEPGSGESDSPLRFEVNAFTVTNGEKSRAAEPSDTPEPEDERERKIRDFWLFQFNTDGTQLAAPAYYSIPENGATLDELTLAAFNNLTKDTPMTIFVITNTGRSQWVTETGAENFDTLDKLKEQKLPSPYPIRAGEDADNDGVADDMYIPMSGQLDNVTVKDKSIIVIPVTRMYAKIKIQVSFNSSDMNFYYANVSGIPWYCKVGPLANEKDAIGEPKAVEFPSGTNFISRAVNSNQVINDTNGNKWLIIYMPENIRGEVAEADKNTHKLIPENALKIDIRSKYDGMDYYYTVYPGENKVNNFNVRRNCVYRVTIDVRSVNDQHNPSSNCFIVKPGEKLSFEPYNRVETGGGYNISTYLDPTKDELKIAKVDIIWQTLNCIGDNTGGDRVRYVHNTDDPIHSKIIIEKDVVQEGNALIGAYNSNGDIIWSWHIWVTANEPDNLANAVTYTTYRWDSRGIYPDEPRIPGYGIMPCNLGALAFRSDDDMPFLATNNRDMKVSGYSITKGMRFPESQIRTFGMLYQWGRKDPFPPMIYSTGTEDLNETAEYTDNMTGPHYANDNKTVVGKTSDYTAGGNLFYSKRLLKTSWRQDYNEENPVKYSIKHPTVYISGTIMSSSILNPTEIYNGYEGDWCGPDGSSGLWGGTEGINGLQVINGHYIYDNYGKKSIFDPCPKGWRVPPGDLWLGFTLTGLNPKKFEEVNYSKEESGRRPGMSMFVQNRDNGPTAYFPLQGTRQYNGRCQNPGLCGNYHNATTSGEHTVNILHLHRNMDVVSGWTGGTTGNMLFRIFETTAANTSRSTASPVRCVRDSR